MELLDSVFEGNDAVDAANSTLEPCDAFVRAAGGAIYSSDGSVHASATRLSNNSAAAWGGALQAVRSTIEIGTGSRFEANRALSAGGGAIAVSGGSLRLEDSELATNDAATSGGAVYCASGSVVMSNSSFASNEAPLGGALAIGAAVGSGCSMRAERLRCTSNSATASAWLPTGGGCVAIAAGSEAVLRDSTIEKNSAVDGGGINLRGALSVNGTLMLRNYASESGGGLYLDRDAHMTANHTLWHANQGVSGGAVRGAGGALALGPGCAFEENVAVDDGGALSLDTTSELLYLASSAGDDASRRLTCRANTASRGAPFKLASFSPHSRLAYPPVFALTAHSSANNAHSSANNAFPRPHFARPPQVGCFSTAIKRCQHPSTTRS